MLDFLFHRSARPTSPAARARLHQDWPAVVYAIGDVHGCYDKLTRLTAAIQVDAAALSGRKLIVMLGDYVDRGPNSAGVLDWLCAAPPAGFDRIALAGNHEVMMLDFLRDPRPNSSWLDLGGTDTLRSYGIDTNAFIKARSRDRQAMLDATIPLEHIELLQNMPSMLTLPHAVFVHAGIRPGIELAAQHDDDLMWIREPFLSHPMPDGLVIVHGHTPSQEPVIWRGRICVDTGAYATGVLTAARLTGTDVQFLDTGSQA